MPYSSSKSGAPGAPAEQKVGQASFHCGTESGSASG